MVEPTWDFSAVITPALDTMKAFFARAAPAPPTTRHYGTDALLDPAPISRSSSAATDLGPIPSSGMGSGAAQALTGLAGGSGGAGNEVLGWDGSQGGSLSSLPAAGIGQTGRDGGALQQASAGGGLGVLSGGKGGKEGVEGGDERENERGGGFEQGREEEEGEEEREEQEGRGGEEGDFDVDAFLARRLPRTYKQLMAGDAVREKSVWRRPMSMNERKKWNDSFE